MKISIKQNIHIDAANAYDVTVTDYLTGQKTNYEVHTDSNGNGLWVDGKQVVGLSQFNCGKKPTDAIRRYFNKTQK